MPEYSGKKINFGLKCKYIFREGKKLPEASLGTAKEKSYIEEQNEIARYRTNIKTFDFYMKESLRISAEIGDLQKEISKLKNENFELALDYTVQTVNDIMNLFSIFGEAVNVAKQQSYDVYSFCFNFALNVDIQNLAESVSDYNNEDRLTQKKVDQIMQKSNEEINYINQRIKGLNSTLKSYEREKEKIKKEMLRKKEYWEND